MSTSLANIKAQGAFGVRVDDVLAAVADHYGVSETELKGEGRRHYLVEARDLYYLLGSRVVGWSGGRLAAWLGGRQRWSGIIAMRRANKRYAGDAKLRHVVAEIEAGLLAIAEMRAQRRLRNAAPREPQELARLIVAGDDRMAMSATVDEIRALAAELLFLQDGQTAEAEDDEGVSYVVTPPVTEETTSEAKAAIGALVEAAAEHLRDMPPRLPPPTLAAIAHDLTGAEAIYRRSPSINVRMACDALVAKLETFESFAPAAAVLRSHRAWRAAQGGCAAGERDALQRYQRAVSALAKNVLTNKEPANG